VNALLAPWINYWAIGMPWVFEVWKVMAKGEVK